MLDVFSQYATDEKVENEGVWVDMGGGRLRIARSGNLKYNQKLAKLTEQNQVALANDDEEADNISEEIMIDVVANTILLGWENLGYKGKLLEYSLENAKLLLSHKDFRKAVNGHSNLMNNYRVIAQEKETKKLKKSSASS